MNLIEGKLVPSGQLGAVLRRLPQKLANTLQQPPLPPQVVINACGQLMKTLPDNAVLPVLESLGMAGAQAQSQLENLRQIFSPQYLARRVEAELGAGYPNPVEKKPYGQSKPVTEQIYPLGVLLHIAAGNMDGLPVYSVVEGLLAGNINLLKLPAVDGGLSVMILQKLIEIEPALAEYVYVFELSSREETPIAQLAALANGIVVWGGDEAVQAVRGMAPVNAKIIEWGHKISFAYATKQGMAQSRLQGLAHNICATNQLLCSSCQGVFVDSEDIQDAKEFAGLFLPVLQQVAAQYPPVPLAARAQSSLQLYSRKLEAGAAIYRGEGVSVEVQQSRELSVSLQFRNIWVRCLPQSQIVPVLYPYKNHLQTAGLLCAPRQWQNLCGKLWRAGVVRVSDGRHMSGGYCGDAHDGEYPLRRYTRVVCAQQG